MSATQVQVLLAIRDTARSASAAQLLMQAGAAVSMIQVRSAQDLLQRMEQHMPPLLVIELDKSIVLFEEVRAVYPYLPIVALVSETLDHRKDHLMQLGAEDVWVLPLHAAMVERIQAVLGKVEAIEDYNPAVAPLRLTGSCRLPDDDPFDAGGQPVGYVPAGDLPVAPPVMVGDNPRMAEIRDIIDKVSGTDVTVLVRGESGVGKEVVARLLFQHSRRQQKPFVKVNCAAIPHDLLESELFGYEAGAFTGAVRSKPGKFELADHGTLFLDEIAEMHPTLQAKLLHVLQDGKFSRLGAKRDVSVDVRIICATNKLLEERVREGLFREDLLYRINVVTIFLPPLRERLDEIPILTDYLLRKYAVEYGRTLAPLSPEVTRRMLDYDWPGNIRELENLCKRFVLVGSETQILRELTNRRESRNLAQEDHSSAQRPVATASSQQSSPMSSTPALSLLEVGRRAAWEAERRAILEMLEATRWNRREAARRLQVSYKALLNKIKQMQLEDGCAVDAHDGQPKKLSSQ